MAESTSFPQIPCTVWSGVWKMLHDSPTRKVDENVLAVELGVQKTAARAYLNELVRLGLFVADGTATDLAKRWRQDGNDLDIIQEILAHAYPSELREIAPVDKLDRAKIIRWFVSQGLGAGSAQNKAATYMRVASGVSAGNAASPKSSRSSSPSTSGPTRVRAGRTPSETKPPERNGDRNARQDDPGRKLDLHVNVQIHISADSTSEQIDTIFSAMKRYFDGASDT